MDTKIVAAAKWSVITEVLAKLITPLTNIILAHMLAPTAFGILATIMMVISFAEMLADAGFLYFSFSMSLKVPKISKRLQMWHLLPT